jgi:CheY-like chemotaxis protein/serine phosphatase RsbU (regulator of sigma subunit)
MIANYEVGNVVPSGNTEKIRDMSSILIVDDNVRNLQVLGGLLQHEGLAVEFALDGKSALNWLNRRKFDLILLDIMMPGMNGYEVCSIIKQTPSINEIPIIFITANTDPESIVMGFEAGAVDYITKPFIQSELLIRVRTQLKIRKSKEQITLYMNEIEEKNRDINNSIEYARYIQEAIIGTSEENLRCLPEHFIINVPKDILSGDFYWITKVENNIIVAVMDCTGHGVPGALMSILGITLLNEIVLDDHLVRPDDILESLREKVVLTLGERLGYRRIKDGIEGAVICFDPASGKLQYSGSFNPLVLINDDEIHEIKADRIPIGYYEVKGNFTLQELNLKTKDTIYLFSDGIVDQFGGPHNKRFMIKHLKETLLANHTKTMARQKEVLSEDLYQWRGGSVQTDDILIVGIRL